MHHRQLTSLDKFIAGIGTALSGTQSVHGRPPRDNPAGKISEADLDDGEKAHAAGLMRVNHAGEVAAQGLYQGHAAVARSAEIEEQMRHAADEERDHLAWCEQRLTELDSEPSQLSPLWFAGSFAIGALSGALGDKWGLGFIAETEKQVCEHLDSHLDRLPEDDARSRAIVEQMRNEEQQHGADAVAAGAAELPNGVQQLMKLTARIMTTTAYRI